MNNKKEFKILKKIGIGGQGEINLVEIKNKKYVLKLEKIFEKDIKKNLSSTFWREIEFNNTICNKYPHFFYQLYNYDIINNCNFKLDNPYKIFYIDELNKSNYCSRKIYEYVDTTLDKIIDKLKLHELYSILAQISYAIYIMNKHGYTHNDLHLLNIGIKKTKIKYIDIFDKKIPTYGNNVKIIDFGSVLHKKYKLNITNFGVDESEILLKNLCEEIRRILDITFELKFYNKIPISFWKNWDSIKELNKFMKSDNLILVDDLVKNDYDKYTLFCLLYPEKSQKLLLKNKFKKTIDNIIRLPIEDIIFLFNVNDIKKIILYFIKKLL